MSIEEEAFELSKKYVRRITPAFVMRKFKLTYQKALEVCQNVWIRQNNEAKALAIKIYEKDI